MVRQKVCTTQGAGTSATLYRGRRSGQRSCRSAERKRSAGLAGRIKPDLWPDPGFVDGGIRGDGSELDALKALEPACYVGEWRDSRFVDAVAAVMDRRMEQDPRVIVLGEDVHRLGGGTNGATKGRTSSDSCAATTSDDGPQRTGR